MIFCFFRASFFFFCSSYLYLPKSRDFTDWGIGVGRYFDEIETDIRGHRKRVTAPDNTHHLAPLVHEAYARDTDLVIDPGSLAGGS